MRRLFAGYLWEVCFHKVLDELRELLSLDGIPDFMSQSLCVGNIVKGDEAGSKWQTLTSCKIVQESSAVVLASGATASFI